MKIDWIGGFCLALVVCPLAVAQETSLTRAEVAAIKAKLVTVEQATTAVIYLKILATFTAVTLIGCAIWLLIW